MKATYVMDKIIRVEVDLCITGAKAPQRDLAMKVTSNNTQRNQER